MIPATIHATTATGRRMDYKGRFLPQQRLAPSGWLRIDTCGRSVFRAAGTKPASVVARVWERSETRGQPAAIRLPGLRFPPPVLARLLARDASAAAHSSSRSSAPDRLPSQFAAALRTSPKKRPLCRRCYHRLDPPRSRCRHTALLLLHALAARNDQKKNDIEHVVLLVVQPHQNLNWTFCRTLANPSHALPRPVIPAGGALVAPPKRRVFEDIVQFLTSEIEAGRLSAGGPAQARAGTGRPVERKPRQSQRGAQGARNAGRGLSCVIGLGVYVTLPQPQVLSRIFGTSDLDAA